MKSVITTVECIFFLFEPYILEKGLLFNPFKGDAKNST